MSNLARFVSNARWLDAMLSRGRFYCLSGGFRASIQWSGAESCCRRPSSAPERTEPPVPLDWLPPSDRARRTLSLPLGSLETTDSAELMSRPPDLSRAVVVATVRCAKMAKHVAVHIPLLMLKIFLLLLLVDQFRGNSVRLSVSLDKSCSTAM